MAEITLKKKITLRRKEELQSDSGDYLEVLADSKEEGHVYCVCSIKNKDGVYALKNESNVMDLSTAYEKIPGFELIVNC